MRRKHCLNPRGGYDVLRGGGRSFCSQIGFPDAGNVSQPLLVVRGDGSDSGRRGLDLGDRRRAATFLAVRQLRSGHRVDPARILGHFPFDFLKHATRTTDRAAQHLDDLQARRPFRDFVSDLQGMRPECRLISISGFPLFDEDGTFKGYRGVARNVTAMADALAELKGPAPQATEASMARTRPTRLIRNS